MFEHLAMLDFGDRPPRSHTFDGDRPPSTARYGPWWPLRARRFASTRALRMQWERYYTDTLTTQRATFVATGRIACTHWMKQVSTHVFLNPILQLMSTVSIQNFNSCISLRPVINVSLKSIHTFLMHLTYRMSQNNTHLFINSECFLKIVQQLIAQW